MICGICGQGEWYGQDAQAGECPNCYVNRPPCDTSGCVFVYGHEGPCVIPPVRGPYEKSREVFSLYAAMDAPKLPDYHRTALNMAALQVRLHRWHVANFNTDNLSGKALGIAEEVGELSEAVLGLAACSGRISHAVLKNGEGIRGMGDETAMRMKIADAVADIQIFAIQLCTLLRLDYGTLLHETAERVMERKWKK